MTFRISDDFLENDHNISSPNWTLESGYLDKLPVDIDTYPYRVFGAGQDGGLIVFLRLYQQNFDYICRGPMQGFKILLHTPGEVPQVSKNFIRISALDEMLIAAKPDMITTANDLRIHSAEERQCYLENERNLRYFKVYTQSNCELECLANFTLQSCGCVKFSMPSKLV